MNHAIKDFKGAYFFLSNFYQAPVVYQGMHFDSSEAALQAKTSSGKS